MAIQEFTPEELAAEEWRPVVGWEGRYEVSNLGRVKSLRGRGNGPPMILLPSVVRGYLRVTPGPRNGKIRTVHSLVAEAFLGPRPAPRDGYRIEANHIDGVKSNCRSGNLEWLTQLENAHHAAQAGLSASGERHGSRTHPDRVPRGERHGSRTHPERFRGSGKHRYVTPPALP